MIQPPKESPAAESGFLPVPIIVIDASESAGAVTDFMSVAIVVVHSAENRAVTISCFPSFAVIVVYAAEETGPAFAYLFAMGIIVIDLPEQASLAVSFLFHSALRRLLYKLFLIDLLHLRNQHGQICCRHIEDAGICRKLAVNIAHHFVGAMACPVKDRSRIRAGAFLELIVRNKRPLGKLLPELLRHVRMTAKEQNALFW